MPLPSFAVEGVTIFCNTLYSVYLNMTNDQYTYRFKKNRTHCFPSKIRTVHPIYGKFSGNDIPSMHGIPYQFHHHILKIVEMRAIKKKTRTTPSFEGLLRAQIYRLYFISNCDCWPLRTPLNTF